VLFEESWSSLAVIESRGVASMYGEAFVEEDGEGVAAGDAVSLL